VELDRARQNEPKIDFFELRRRKKAIAEIEACASPEATALTMVMQLVVDDRLPSQG